MFGRGQPKKWKITMKNFGGNDESRRKQWNTYCADVPLWKTSLPWLWDNITLNVWKRQRTGYWKNNKLRQSWKFFGRERSWLEQVKIGSWKFPFLPIYHGKCQELQTLEGNIRRKLTAPRHVRRFTGSLKLFLWYTNYENCSSSFYFIPADYQPVLISRPWN